MLLTNPYSKGKWFTVKVNGVPQKIFIPAHGSYELSNISKIFDTSEMTDT
jgi:hypothetical protein